MSATIDGLFNFRDTGGMPIAGGGHTASGVLYRSAALSGLTPAGLEQLAATDIGVIADFRTQTEQEMAPDRIPDARPFTVVNLPLLEGAVASMTGSMAPAAGGGTDAVPPAADPAADPAAAAAAAAAGMLSQIPALGDLYVSMLEHGAETFAHLGRLVAAATVDPPTAVLVHCTAGKDRTGVSCALMLDAAGAERSAVVADYAASQDYLAGPWADGMFAMVEKAGVPLTDQIRDLIAKTPSSAIEQALAWVDAHGGSAAYLQSGGLTDAELAGLRARLTADSRG